MGNNVENKDDRQDDVPDIKGLLNVPIRTNFSDERFGDKPSLSRGFAVENSRMKASENTKHSRNTTHNKENLTSKTEEHSKPEP